MTRIVRTFFVALISVLSFWGTVEFCSASTIFTDDFNNYNNGNLGGQGGWIGGLSETIIQDNTVFEGAKAVNMHRSIPGTTAMEKSGALINDGKITIYIRRHIGGTTNPFFEISLKEGNSDRIKVKTGGLDFRYWNGLSYVNFGPHFASDTWYSLQIQWRSSDHKVRYRINDGSFTDWYGGLTDWLLGVDTVKISLGNGAGFVDTIQENLIGEKNPVLIIPGISGTELWNGDEYIWANLTRMSTDIGDQFLTENLSLDENGDSVQDISVGDVIKRKIALLIFDQNIFEALEQKLVLDGYELNKDIFYYPYDWRLDLNSTKELLKEEINTIKLKTGLSKVDIVAHSMGGLLTKAYIETYGKDSIDKLIFIGTPHIGAPKAGKALLEGDDFGIPWLAEARIKELALNMPSIHQLLPNRAYFNDFQGYIKPFSLLGDRSLYDYDQTKEYFLNDKNKNPIMFDKAEDFFNQNLDSLDLSGIDAYNIAGCKSSTQAAYEMSFFGNVGWVGYTSGDGTVPLVSSDYLDIPETNKYHVKNGNHSELPSTNGVRELILDILSEQSSTLPSNISLNADFCSFKGKVLTWRSPVEVHIYDQFNNHAGPIESGVIEYGIKGVDYEIIEGEKFIFLPTDENQEYVIDGIGEDYGTFDLLISDVDSGNSIETFVYNDVPIVPNSKVNFNISEDSNNTVITYDFENSGQFYEIEADSVLSGIQSDDLVPPQTQISLAGKEHNDGSFISDVLVAMEAADNVSGILEMWYSLDGETFREYIEPFVLERRDVYDIYYYSVDRAGNNEEISILKIQIGVTDQQYEKCWQDGRCSKFLMAGEKAGKDFRNIRKEFFNENVSNEEVDKKINIIKSKLK